jgi:DNA-binding NarL/FixJ family response regulator
VLETIRICKDRNILKEYLESREKEVVDIMMTLFDDEYILKTYVEEERKDAKMEEKKETALRMAKKGTAVDVIADFLDVSISLVKKWLEGSMTLAK